LTIKEISLRTQVDSRDNGTETSVTTHKQQKLCKKFRKITTQMDEYSHKCSSRGGKICSPEFPHFNTQNIHSQQKMTKHAKRQKNVTHS
jgi:hypothetical protein